MDNFLALQISKAQAFIGESGFPEPDDFSLTDVNTELGITLFESNYPEAAKLAVEHYNLLFCKGVKIKTLTEISGDATRQIAGSLCLTGLLYSKITPTYHIDLVHNRALITSRIAYDIASLTSCHLVMPHDAYLSTYMSFTGSMILASKYGRDYADFFERFSLTPYTTAREETLNYGMSSHFISSAISATWGLNSNSIKGILGSQYKNLNFIADTQVRLVSAIILLSSCVNRYMQGFEGDEFMEMLLHSQAVAGVQDKELDRILARTKLSDSRMLG